ncbi:MAG: DUF2520 domain-containing protein [Deltaproteobacteria bacterium]|nr:DUF2520 domain-containing protein [Deltaproteobacteria bacterium]
MKSSFVIVGCGKVGTAMGRNFINAGYRLIGLSCNTQESAQKAANILSTDNFTKASWEITKGVNIVFITTPDGVISNACNEIAQKNGFDNNTVIFHCSGALPSTILFSAKACGASIGSMHPLQSFAVGCSDATFKNVIVTIEGEKDAVNAAKQITEDLGSTCLTIKTEAKTLYHASAVVASNYLVTLQDFALKLIKKAGISGDDAFKVLSPLIKGTLSNIKNVGTIKALTGPIARGDIETITKHLDEIGEKTPNLLLLYKILAQYTVDIALAGGTIFDSKANELKKVISL